MIKLQLKLLRFQFYRHTQQISQFCGERWETYAWEFCEVFNIFQLSSLKSSIIISCQRNVKTLTIGGGTEAENLIKKFCFDA